MEIVLGLLIIAIGAFCQSSCYVPINKIKDWSWESYWIIQGVFAWLVLPFLGALLAVPAGESLFGLFADAPSFNLWMTIFFGVLWGVGGLTFGLSMRYLGVALGQSIALGTCAGLGTIMGPVLLNIFFPELNALDSLTYAVIIGVVVTLLGIAIIGMAGSMKAASLSEEEKKAAVKDFNFPKGLAIALLAGFMSGCFNVGLEFGKDINFGELTDPMFRTLPATFLVTFGGFITNAIYCFYQNQKNGTWSDYTKSSVWGNNLLFCLLAGALWYSQFFGLSLGKGFLTESPTLTTLAFCILMALNVVFSNVWGIILKEWKGCSQKTITVLIVGIIVLVISCFLPQLI
ncbi:MAG: L-rhamnose/proton symporter RhaT [Prevotella sp.]|jgi:L-rhamnose-H+ transport protein|nr:L-rhamnose/proton symporter RhaT [Prevotella sp.]MBO5641311.1 L-rhamnose/proton symporter RhaT [Prevotella sp.]